METGDLPTPEPESVEHWHRIACNWLRRFVPRWLTRTKRKAGSGTPTRQNVYNFNGVFYGDVSIYEEGDNVPKVVVRRREDSSSEDEQTDIPGAE